MQVGRFEVQSEIARGGQGAIFDAWDPTSQRRVALKLLRADRNSVTAERLLREGQALTQLRHPGLVPCLEVGQVQGAIYLALGFVEGTTVGELLRTEGALPLRRALRVADDLAGIVDYVHSRGVIHRDLKPDNVLLSPSGQVVLADFGLAKGMESAGESLTRTGAAMGTPGYWAPEQVRGQKELIGPQTDVYGWGATAYALFTGDAPRAASTLQEMIDGLDVPPPALRVRRGDVPPWLDALLSSCLAADPSERPTLSEVRRVLAQGLRGDGHGEARRVSGRVVLGGVLVALIACGVGWIVVEAGEPPADSPPTAPETSPTPPDPPPEASPSLDPRARVERARVLLGEQRFEDVLRLYQGVDLSQAGAAPFAQLGEALAGLGRFEEALEQLDAAVRLDPLPATRIVRAGVRLELGDASGALADARAGVEANLATSELVVAYSVLASALRRLHRPQEGLEEIERALGLHEAAPLQRSRGWLLFDLERYGEAAAAFARAGELAPGVFEYLALQATALVEAGEANRALMLVNGSREPEAAWVVAWIVGRTALEDGNLDSALNTLNHAVSMSPQVAALTDRGRVKLAQGDAEGALQDFRAALDQDEEPRAWLGLAQACQALGRADEQRQAARAYLRVRPWGRERAAAEALAR